MTESAPKLGRSQRRDDILLAARHLMQEAGDVGFSMRGLAVRAGVSIATPYNLFGSKQAILLAVLNDDLVEYEQALAGLEADAIDVLFQSQTLVSELVRRKPDFYRNVIYAVSRDGPEFRHMVSGPRYVLWKRLLRQATQAGLLQESVDPDAFAIATSQLVLANVLEWAQGALTLEEMEARNKYGLALALMAIATERSLPQIRAQFRDAERSLQRLWRTALAERLRDGTLDEESREILADQLRGLHLEQENANDQRP